MGAQTKTVGGGANTRTANNWNNFLNDQLGAPQSQMPGQLKKFGDRWGITPQLQALYGAGQQGQSSSTGQFRDLVNQAASGVPIDPSGGYSALQRLITNPQGAMQFNNNYNPQSFQRPDFAELPTNFGAGQTGMANLSGVNPLQQANFNVMQGFGQQANLPDAGIQDAQSIFQKLAGGAGSVSLAPARSIEDIRNNELAGAFEFAEIMRKRAIADQNERYGAEGIGALGTGAQFANATLNADLAARNAQNAFDMINRAQQLDLANRVKAAEIALGSAQLNTNALLGAASQLQQGALGTRAQDLQNQLGNRGYDINQLGLGNQQAIANMQAMLGARGQDVDALLRNQQLGNNFGLTAAQLNNNAMQMNNANNFNLANMNNAFNLQNEQNRTAGANFADQMNFNSQNAAFNNNLNAIIQGLGQNNFASQQQQNLLNQLFGSFRQSNEIGSPRRQVISQPSAAQQFLSAGLDIGGLLLGRPPSGSFGGGGPTPSFNPNMNVYSGANFGIGQPGGYGFGGIGQGSPFGIGNPGGYSMNSLDLAAIQADPQGFQNWMRSGGAAAMGLGAPNNQYFMMPPNIMSVPDFSMMPYWSY